MSSHQLVRVRNGAMIAGVCAGLARRFGLHPWAVRGIFLAFLFLPGSSILVYLILWVALKQE